jgi:hypothetical protein
MTTLVDAFSSWLATTGLSWAARGGVPWIWPLCETLHFMGMAMLVGVVGFLDLRLIGMGKGLPIAPISGLLPWGIAGFLLNLATGFVFYAGDPLQYSVNPAFRLKMLFVVLAGLNVLVFYATGLRRTVDAVGAGEDAPFAARLLAATSLFLWVGVMYWGRMLPFVGDAF